MFTGFHLVILGFNQFYWVLPSFTGFLPCFTGFCLCFFCVWLYITGFNLVFMDCT